MTAVAPGGSTTVTRTATICAQQLLEPAAIEEPAALAVHRQRDEAQRQRADQTGHQMDADNIKRIIKTELVLQAHGPGRTRHRRPAPGPPHPAD